MGSSVSGSTLFVNIAKSVKKVERLTLALTKGRGGWAVQVAGPHYLYTWQSGRRKIDSSTNLGEGWVGSSVGGSTLFVYMAERAKKVIFERRSLIKP